MMEGRPLVVIGWKSMNQIRDKHIVAVSNLFFFFTVFIYFWFVLHCKYDTPSNKAHIFTVCINFCTARHSIFLLQLFGLPTNIIGSTLFIYCLFVCCTCYLYLL